MTPSSLIILLSLLAFCMSGLRAQQPSAAVPMLRAGFPTYAFTGIEAGDVEIAADFYIKKIAQDVDIPYSSHVYRDRQRLFDDMASGNLNFVLLSAADYLTSPVRTSFIPILIPVRGDEVTSRLLLLARKTPSGVSLENLRGKSLLMANGSDALLETTWLNRELSKAALPPLRDHFRSVEYPQAAAKAVLPVFFGKADSCIVSESLYSIVADLNPQVKERLTIVASSEDMTLTVLCVRSDYPAAARERLIRAAERLSATPDGRQLLTLTRLKSVVRFQPSFLRSAEALFQTSNPSDPAAPVVVPPDSSLPSLPNPGSGPSAAAARMPSISRPPPTP